MELIPAIDLLGGKCVRLVQGKFDQSRTYAEDPARVAQDFEAAGAKRIHVIDLDAARSGVPHHGEAIRSIVRSTSCRVQVGGGIRSLELALELLTLGVDRVIMGTALINDTLLAQRAAETLGDRLVGMVDGLGGMAAIRGWTETTGESVADAIRRLATLGISRFAVTDVQRDGTLSGPNIEQLRSLAAAAERPLIASGGIGSLDHLMQLREARIPRLEGVIVGRAIYEGSINLQEAVLAMNS